MTAPSPTVAPTLGLPAVHVHGATSWRRRVWLVLLAIVPAVAAFVVGLVAPLRDPASGSTLPAMAVASTVWLLLAARAHPPFAPWSRHIAATFVGVAWALGAASATMDRDVATWSSGAVAIVAASTLIGTWAAWWLGGSRFGVVWPLVRPTPFAVRITADRRGLRIRSRILGTPLVTVPLDRIAAASAACIDDTEWGQVGSTADRELTTIIQRSGAALIDTRTDGSMVVVTADRPDLEAAVLESLRPGAARG